MATIVRTITLVDTSCCNCGMVFAVPDWWLEQRRSDGKNFTCPNGHTLQYSETEADRLRKRVSQLEAQKTHLADQRDAERRARESVEKSASALRGANTKLRKRVANGVCPCCSRSFTNLRRHMTTKHPDFSEVPGGDR